MMPFQVCMLPYSLSEIFAQASRSRRISRSEYERLLLALMQNLLSEDERSSIKRLMYAVRRKRIKVEGSPHFLLSISDLAS